MKDILDTLVDDGSFCTILSLLQQTKLADVLKGKGPFTFFAPNDEAFARVEMQEITKDPAYLLSLLDYHILDGVCSFPDISSKLEILTRSGKSLTVLLEEGSHLIDNARFLKTDIECLNGCIHVIDNVFLPQFSGWYEE